MFIWINKKSSLLVRFSITVKRHNDQSNIVIRDIELELGDRFKVQSIITIESRSESKMVCHWTVCEK